MNITIKRSNSIQLNKQLSCAEETFDKIDAIQDNLKILVDNFNDMNEELDWKYPEAKEYDMDSILLDLTSAEDEFFVRNEASNNGFVVEVVTKEVAESNDRDFVNTDNNYSQAEVNSYEVGGMLSDYTKLGNSEFYYRLM